MEKFCGECGRHFTAGGIFCPKCGKTLTVVNKKVEPSMQHVFMATGNVRMVNDGNKEEYPTHSVECVGDRTIVAVSKYDIKMEVYQSVVGNRETVVYERALLPSEVEYNLFILRYIVNNTKNVDLLNGTMYPFPNVGKYITFVDIDDNTLRARSELDKTTWGTLRIFGMEPFIKRYRPIPFNPKTRAKGDRIRFYIDPTDMSQIMTKIVKINR